MSATSRALTLATFVAIGGALIAAPGCIIVSDDDATLTIDNESQFDLVEIRLADVGSDSWGPNYGPVLSGDSLELSEIDCDFYDLRLFDSGDEGCDLLDLDLCLNDSVFIYEDDTCTSLTVNGQVVTGKKRTRAEMEADMEKEKQLAPTDGAASTTL